MAEYIHTGIMIVAFEHNHDHISEAYMRAKASGLPCTGVVVGHNGILSFMIGPDGSAGGLHASNERGQKARAEIVAHLRTKGTALEWVEVVFGREHGKAVVQNDCVDAESRAGMKWHPRKTLTPL